LKTSIVRQYVRVRALVATALAALAAGSGAAAKPPPAGLVVPNVSLGGLRLGMTPAQVQAAWGDHGRCRGCRHPTWYFNYAPFTPQGTGVEFRKGRAAAIFTLYAPASWHTPKGLVVGDPVARVTKLYGALPRVDCGGYYALTVFHVRTMALFYIADEKVYGFGLNRVEVPACR
jgi:hypothetical protein